MYIHTRCRRYIQISRDVLALKAWACRAVIWCVRWCCECEQPYWLVWMESYLYAFCIVIQEQHTRAGHLLGLHHGLQVSQQGHVFGHVCGQHLDTKRESKAMKEEQKSISFASLNFSLTVYKNLSNLTVVWAHRWSSFYYRHCKFLWTNSSNY